MRDEPSQNTNIQLDELKFTDLVDVIAVQRLMELFLATTDIPVGILDVDGTILVATGWQDICTKFHRAHPVTSERCRQSDAYIGQHLQQGKYVEYKCANGLRDVALPIVIEGRHMATLFLGQFKFEGEEPDVEFFRRQAREFGFDEDAYLESLARVPVFSEEKVRNIMEFYSSLVEILSDMGRTRLLHAKMERALWDIEEQKRLFYRQTILSVTEGKLDICEQEDTRRIILQAGMCVDVREAAEVAEARRVVREFCERHGLGSDRLETFMIAVGEAITNSVKHGDSGKVLAGVNDDSVWVGVADEGPGIEALVLPGAILRRGFSTKPSLGLGYSIILDASDRVMLSTDEHGTTVVLVKNFAEDPDCAFGSLPDAWSSVLAHMEEG